MLRDTDSCVICTLIYLEGIFTCESDIYRRRRSPLSVYLVQYPRPVRCNTYTFQVARDVRGSQEILVDIFERIENFFRRLAIYTEVPPTPEMVDMMVKIMVEVLSVLGITTKEIKQSQTSEYSLYMHVTVDWIVFFRKISEETGGKD